MRHDYNVVERAGRGCTTHRSDAPKTGATPDLAAPDRHVRVRITTSSSRSAGCGRSMPATARKRASEASTPWLELSCDPAEDGLDIPAVMKAIMGIRDGNISQRERAALGMHHDTADSRGATYDVAPVVHGSAE